MNFDTTPAAVVAMIDKIYAHLDSILHARDNEVLASVHIKALIEEIPSIFAMIAALADERDAWREKYNALGNASLAEIAESGRHRGKAEAEAAALREALREISGLCPVTCDMSVAHEMAAIADAALKENHDD